MPYYVTLIKRIQFPLFKLLTSYPLAIPLWCPVTEREIFKKFLSLCQCFETGTGISAINLETNAKIIHLSSPPPPPAPPGTITYTLTQLNIFSFGFTSHYCDYKLKNRLYLYEVMWILTYKKFILT